ncbi:SDR family NAD(P)-dependent oxidoreductase [Algicola sagamiensis]|uniref:SDR family NAD(P)-dependent oxidoreductase n=1 Tax=Algicola sagamiensis TaxID=163869 RepID=UPI000380A85F|nr:SDR family NAD(P)-dependent oxidoreductase [Algicola sagamiensis]
MIEDHDFDVIIGASGGLGDAVLKQSIQEKPIKQVVAISRSTKPLDYDPKLGWFQTAYHEDAIQSCCEQLASLQGKVHRVFICTGVLHGTDFFPEKKLEDLAELSMEKVYHANVVVPMLFIKYLTPLLRRKNATIVSVLSARVGSIEDNQLGGWYAYRASKAALNMMLKTTAIEFSRRAKNVKIIAFHPGTTNTSLSKPFQANVKPEKLFAPDFVAKQLSHLTLSIQPDGALSYLDWNHQPIKW